jgi:phosphate transport system permease protein
MSTRHISPRVTQKIAFGVMWGAGALAVAALLFIIGYVLFHGLSVLSLDFVFSSTTSGGLRAPLIGTLYTVALTLLVVVPLGVGAAVWLVEYAPVKGRISSFIRYTLDGLAGIPSIIFGLFGAALFVYLVIGERCVLAGALTLACLSLPFMVGAAEGAIRSVPQSQKEAALALGATRWQVIWRVVIPGALPGIITGAILCAGRAIEETAPLLVTSGFSDFTPHSPFDPCRTLSLHLFYLATAAAPIPGRVTHADLIDQAMGVGVILILVIIMLNLLMRFLSGRYIARMRGGR